MGVDSTMSCPNRTAHAYFEGLDISCLPFRKPLGLRLALFRPMPVWMRGRVTLENYSNQLVSFLIRSDSSFDRSFRPIRLKIPAILARSANAVCGIGTTS